MPLPDLLRQRLAQAFGQLELELPADFNVTVGPATDARFGDYQSNSVMNLAKQIKRNPRELAQQVIERFQGDDLCGPPELAGPGFLNFRLKEKFLAEQVVAIHSDPRLGVAAVEHPETIVIDFSAPNIAKPMHVGHIRSTIIGDCLARVARFLGHRVITDNHIGDWGTQFGMVILGWKQHLDRAALEADPIAELLRIYRTANAAAKADEAVMKSCREELVKLQQGDAENLGIWRQTVELSLGELRKIYQRLDINFDYYLGESFYNDKMASVVEELSAKGIAKESEGALCVFFPDVPELGEKPAIIRKRDGGFNYAASDLATIEHRLKEWRANKIWYVVGAPQQLHFQQLFAIAQRWGREVEAVHIAHGSILGSDRKLMRTRVGDSVELKDLLDEAEERSLAIVEQKNPHFTEEEKRDIAAAIGLGAVKYAELCQHRMTDYVFAWEKMLSFQGNTAPYIQNAYVRTRSIFRKLGVPVEFTPDCELSHPNERSLALKLLQYAEIVPDVLRDFRPNLLAAYLFELAQEFHPFWENCPVLSAEGLAKNTRLLLCDLTSQVLRQGLGLMGIRVTEKM